MQTCTAQDNLNLISFINETQTCLKHLYPQFCVCVYACGGISFPEGKIKFKEIRQFHLPFPQDIAVQK